jgi:hypothetical protein
VALTFALHVAVLVILFVIGAIGTGLGWELLSGFFVLALGGLILVGVTQVLYVGPAFLVARRRGLTRLAQGLAVGAGITVLLNAACWGTVLLSAANV